jgi:hypothetical protein
MEEEDEKRKEIGKINKATKENYPKWKSFSIGTNEYMVCDWHLKSVITRNDTQYPTNLLLQHNVLQYAFLHIRATVATARWQLQLPFITLRIHKHFPLCLHLSLPRTVERYPRRVQTTNERSTPTRSCAHDRLFAYSFVLVSLVWREQRLVHDTTKTDHGSLRKFFI